VGVGRLHYYQMREDYDLRKTMFKGTFFDLQNGITHNKEHTA